MYLGSRFPKLKKSALGFHYGKHLVRSEEHTSELQSRPHLVCRLLPEKKKRVALHPGDDRDARGAGPRGAPLPGPARLFAPVRDLVPAVLPLPPLEPARRSLGVGGAEY